MHIRCPHCHNPIEVVDDDSAEDVICSSCGSAIDLVVEAKTIKSVEVATKSIAHIELSEQLGVGTFGSVWKAHDTELDLLPGMIPLWITNGE